MDGAVLPAHLDIPEYIDPSESDKAIDTTSQLAKRIQTHQPHF